MPDECTFVLLFCQEIFILTMLTINSSFTDFDERQFV